MSNELPNVRLYRHSVVCGRVDATSRSRLNCAVLRAILAVLLLTVSSSTNAALINAASCSQADVHAALNTAHDGDIVSIPAGTCTWTRQVILNQGSRSLTIRGAGIDATTIIDNVPKLKGGSGLVLWVFHTKAGTSLHLTGITFQGLAQDTKVFNKGTLVFEGTSHSVRIDHIKIDRPGTGAMVFSGDIWGVVDHCIFNTPNFKQGIQIFSQNWNGGTYGDGSFEDSLRLGSGEGLYIEDNTFTGSGKAGAGVTDSTRGGRFVFRYNTVTSDNAATHGTEGQRYRGVRSYEFYNNTFTNPNSIMFCAIYLRGGTGVIWGNTFRGGEGQTGYRNAILTSNYRSFQNQQPWGRCNGNNPWDGNTDKLGYPALDQVGRGTSTDQIRGNRPVNRSANAISWPHNASEPLYVWNNNWTPVPNHEGHLIASQQPVIKAGRDWIEAPMPGYTPYTYPHPLTLSQATPMPGVGAIPSSQHNAPKKAKDVKAQKRRHHGVAKQFGPDGN